MKKILSFFILAATALSCTAQQKYIRLAQEIASSEMKHNPEMWTCDGAAKPKWEYTPTLMARAFLELYNDTKDTTYLNHVQRFADLFIDRQGKILTYKKSLYNMDRIQGGNFLIILHTLNPQPQYITAIETLREQVKEQPRTSEGGFWHKMVYPDQMWLDGLYMAQPFYAEYTRRYEASERRDSCYRDVLNHFLVVARHTYDPATGLYRHAWDESRKMFWCDPDTGQSDHAWGRALGWYCMAIVDVLEIVPRETEGWNEVLSIFRGIFDTLPEYADPATGMWYQVLDQPGREGNYVEATCSAMFTYAMLKGIRLGFLDKSLHKEACRNYSRLLETFVTTGADGLVSLERCCAVAGLGGKDNRRGDYGYYINERICENDPKGIGPLIWASLEMERK